MSQDYLPGDFALPPAEELVSQTHPREEPCLRREMDYWFEHVDQARCPVCRWPLVPRILYRRVHFWCACPGKGERGL